MSKVEGTPRTPTAFLEAEEARLTDELARLASEPFLPVEKKLVGWSVGLGIALLLLLVWANYAFFSG